jgi:hypothetical protein
MYGAANRKVLKESCKENGAAVADLAIYHGGAAYRKVLEESCTENGAAIADLAIYHKVRSARRKLQGKWSCCS